MKKIISIVLIIILVCSGIGGYLIYWSKTHSTNENLLGFVKGSSKLIDDWEYKGAAEYDRIEESAKSSTMALEDSTIGLSTGGAKNIENFRENIKNGYFPISTDITYNGLFYDYYFDTGRNGTKSEELFSPSYSTAVSKDPISNENEYYMTVGLNSNIKESDFSRKKLNVVLVVDISGSMSSSFKSYYYDNKNKNAEDSKSKMKIANESVNLLIDELNAEDRLGIVLFDDSAYLAKPMNLVKETDIEKIKEHVLEIQPNGGTNFSTGYSEATKLFNSELLNDEEYENRIIVITDAMPNMGNTSKEGLAQSVQKNAEQGLYTTFVGVGVDFNTEVIECLSNVEGSNYYSVHSSQEFKKIMSEDFEYMVTPLVFDLELNFESDMFEIENVYGTDCKDKTSGTIMKVNTLFPSSSNSNGENKGGIILLKLKCKEKNINKAEFINTNNKISVKYKDRDGKTHSNSQEVKFNDISKEYYDNTGIRKGIVLTRYANLMKDWILFERSEKEPIFEITEKTGIVDCDYSIDQVYKLLGQHERRSVKLSVSDEYKELFKEFKEYFEKEMKELSDDEMKQEIELLNMLIK